MAYIGLFVSGRTCSDAAARALRRHIARMIPNAAQLLSKYENMLCFYTIKFIFLTIFEPYMQLIDNKYKKFFWGGDFCNKKQYEIFGLKYYFIYFCT